MLACLRRSPGVALAAIGAISLLAMSCGGGSSPSSSTPPTTVPSTPVATPPPASGGGDAFSQLNCPFGKGDANAKCERRSPALLNDVEAAMDALVKQKPQIFDLNDEASPGTRAYRVLDKNAFAEGLVFNLRAAGLCSERDGDDALLETIKVKNASDFSEDFDVLLSSGHMRRGAGAYRQTCNPSSFPVERSADSPPIGSGCLKPYPPPVTRIKCEVHMKGSEYYTLDATPMVGPNIEYCASVGFPDRSICPIRTEDAPDRTACEQWRVGKAKDTGRPGPTWTKADGSYCTGPASGCSNHPDNQFQLWTYGKGSWVATAENGAYCTISY
jgi:hypothetical protein